MTEPQYLKENKTLANGKPNPAFYEALIATISQLCPSTKEPLIEICINCSQEAIAMYDYKNRNWYAECACPELPNIVRETKDKALIAWNVMQTIKQFEKDGLV